MTRTTLAGDDMPPQIQTTKNENARPSGKKAAAHAGAGDEVDAGVLRRLASMLLRVFFFVGQRFAAGGDRGVVLVTLACASAAT